MSHERVMSLGRTSTNAVSLFALLATQVLVAIPSAEAQRAKRSTVVNRMPAPVVAPVPKPIVSTLPAAWTPAAPITSESAAPRAPTPVAASPIVPLPTVQAPITKIDGGIVVFPTPAPVSPPAASAPSLTNGLVLTNWGPSGGGAAAPTPNTSDAANRQPPRNSQPPASPPPPPPPPVTSTPPQQGGTLPPIVPPTNGPLDLARFTADVRDANGTWVNLLQGARAVAGDFNDPRCNLAARLHVLRKVGDVQYYGIVQGNRLSIVAQRDLYVHVKKAGDNIFAPHDPTQLTVQTIAVRVNGQTFQRQLPNGSFARVAETARFPWDWSRVRQATQNGVFLLPDATLRLGMLGSRSTGDLPQPDLSGSAIAGERLPPNSATWYDSVRSGQGGSYISSRAPHHGWIAQAVYASWISDTAWLGQAEQTLRNQAEWAGYFPQWSAWNGTTHGVQDLALLQPINYLGNRITTGGRFVPKFDMFNFDVSHHYNGRGLAYAASCDVVNLIHDQMNATNAELENVSSDGPIGAQQDRGTGDAIAAFTMAYQLTPASVPSWILPKSYFESRLRAQGRHMAQAFANKNDQLKDIGAVVTHNANTAVIGLNNGQTAPMSSAFFIMGRVYPALWLARRAGITEFDPSLQSLGGYIELVGQSNTWNGIGYASATGAGVPIAPNTSHRWQNGASWVTWLDSLPANAPVNSSQWPLGDYPNQLGSAMNLIADARGRGWVSLDVSQELSRWQQRAVNTPSWSAGNFIYLGQVYGRQP